MMKRMLLVSLAAVCLAASGARGGAAAGFSIGPEVRYLWWNPYFENYVRGHDQDYGSARSSFSMRNSAFYYGPAASYSFTDRWSLSGTFLFSVQQGLRAEGRYLWAGPGYAGYANPHARHIGRYDIDLLAGCALNNIVTLVIGAQSRVYNYSGASPLLMRHGGTLVPLQPSSKMLSWGFGLCAGGMVKVPLAEGLTLDILLHALCLPGENRSSWLVKRKDPFVSYGGEGGLTLSYFFKKLNASISIGGRYRVLRYSLLPGADSDEGRFVTPYAQMYGVTFAALFLL